jgi:hypothetical protein
MKKRPEFQTLDAAKAYILQKEVALAKPLSVGKRASGDKPFNPDAITDAEGDPEGSSGDDKATIADLRDENTRLKAHIAELEKQLKEAKKAQPKDDPADPDEKNTFSKAGVTESSLAAVISKGGDYRKVWAAQRALDALQLARVNAASYPKARR